LLRRTLRNLRLGEKGRRWREGEGQKRGDYMTTKKTLSQGAKLFLVAELLKLGRMFLQEITAQPSLNLAFLCNVILWLWKSHVSVVILT